MHKLTKRILKNIRARSLYYRSKILDPSPKLLILLYHRILPDEKFNPLRTIVSSAVFRQQLNYLRERYQVVSLNDAVLQCQSGALQSKSQAVITFDDGYIDNYEIAFPILKESGLSATFFLPTEYIGSKRILWDWEMINLLSMDQEGGEIRIDNKLVKKRAKEPQPVFWFRVIRLMKSIGPEERCRIINFLLERQKTELKPPYAHDFCLTWEQAKEMAECGMEIGSHGISHRSLSGIPAEEARNEIKLSKEIIESKIGLPCNHFAFPFGSKPDFNRDLINFIEEAGFKSCLLNIFGYNRFNSDHFCFKRIRMEEGTNLNYLPV